jgi:hypothetical protein
LTLKKFLRFPELLLFISAIISLIVLDDTATGSQWSGTYYEFANHKWIGSIFFIPIAVMLIFSWLLHMLLRKHRLMSTVWHWIYVAPSVILLIALIVAEFLIIKILRQPAYSFSDMSTLNLFSGRFLLLGFLLILWQLVFWVNTALLILRKRKQERHRALS